mmetsp:Transcript_28212/g.86465  ORF Transcript_28212/g.86465 Transcript_28212/m.86465 type:complete len:219 (+) Transcript_28212:1192-1848(+)
MKYFSANASSVPMTASESGMNSSRLAAKPAQPPPARVSFATSTSPDTRHENVSDESSASAKSKSGSSESQPLATKVGVGDCVGGGVAFGSHTGSRTTCAAPRLLKVWYSKAGVSKYAYKNCCATPGSAVMSMLSASSTRLLVHRSTKFPFSRSVCAFRNVWFDSAARTGNTRPTRSYFSGAFPPCPITASEPAINVSSDVASAAHPSPCFTSIARIAG